MNTNTCSPTRQHVNDHIVPFCCHSPCMYKHTHTYIKLTATVCFQLQWDKLGQLKKKKIQPNVLYCSHLCGPPLPPLSVHLCPPAICLCTSHTHTHTHKHKHLIPLRMERFIHTDSAIRKWRARFVLLHNWFKMKQWWQLLRTDFCLINRPVERA